MSTAADRTYTTTVGSQELDLPLVALSDELTIALLITVDLGVAFAETAGRELAELMRPAQPEIIVSVATMGIPLAIEASRALGLDDYVILHKTPKIHLGETWAEPVYSITTDTAAAPADGSGPGRRRAGPAGGGGRRRHLHRCLAVVRPAAGPPHGCRAGRHRDSHDRRRGMEACAGRGRGPGPHARQHAAVPCRRLRELVEDWD